MSSGNSAVKRIPELDGLRGVAILLVLSFHYLNNQLVHSEFTMGEVIAKVTSFGWVGVDLFFVLSGFLIGGILFRYKGSQNFFSTFYIRRLVRIVPNYYLLLLIFVAIQYSSLFSGNHFLSGGKEVPWWSYFAMVHNLFMAKLNTLGNDALSVTWSIGIEEQFYIFFPLVVYFLDLKYIPYFLILAIVVANILRAGFEHWIPPYVLLPCRMDALSMGVGVAWLDQKYGIKEVVLKRYRLLLTLIGAAILTSCIMYVLYQDLGFVRNSIFALIFSVLLMLSLVYTESILGTILRNRMLMWVGTISYSLYLFHYLILGLFHELILGQQGIIMRNTKDVFLTIAAFIFSMLFSWLIYRYLETPYVRFGKKFKY